MALFKGKPKLFKGNAFDCFGAKRALVRLATNKFAARIRNFYNNFLGINGAKKNIKL